MSFLAKIVAFFMSIAIALTGWVGYLPQHTLKVNQYDTHQTNEGFGTSGAWWAQDVADEAEAERIAALLFNKETGLGLDIFRYNVGAGEKENPASVIPKANHRTESFWVFNESTGEYEYDFSRDANAVRMMDLAVRNGATKIVLFCNSPHFSLTESGRASGSPEEGRCNLPPENYAAFADYLLTVAEHFIEEGYPVYGVSPINEPQWDWGAGSIKQEGCHYSPEEAVALLECFATRMQERGDTFKLLGPESGSMNKSSVEYEKKFYASKILREFCDVYSGHSYWLDGNTKEKKAVRQRFALNYRGLKFEMSEWCELPQTLDPLTIESGLHMANVMWEDLTLMNAVSWQNWTAVGGDALLDYKNGELVQYYRYYIMKQFAMIPPGAVRVGVLDYHMKESTLKTLAYTDCDADYLIIINNEPEEENVRLNGAYEAQKVFVTSADKKCEAVFDGEFTDSLTLEPQSVTTLILSANRD
ncbi:MAG: hypothetical protein IJK23_13180 [Clostridia bacterium]|nr:hypothetical protein [Clostridia bacterium]